MTTAQDENNTTANAISSKTPPLITQVPTNAMSALSISQDPLDREELGPLGPHQPTDQTTSLYPKIFKLTDFIHTIKTSLPEPHPNSIGLTGTVKLHGTHADIVFTPHSNEVRCQSRNKLALVPGKEDNAGFAAFVAGIEQRRLLTLRDRITERYQGLNGGREVEGEVVVAGEWCGEGIQKGVAVAQMRKFLAIVSICVNGEWLPDWDFADICDEGARVFHIGKAGFFEHEVRLNEVEGSERRIRELTDGVEKECPFAKQFGVEGVGEGIVWKAKKYCGDPRFWFKSKGDRWAVSQSHKLPASAVDKENRDRVDNFARAIVTEMRLEQGWDFLEQKDARGLGSFLKWIMEDCMVEEKLEMERLGIGRKILNPAIARIAKPWFWKKLEAMAKW